MRISKFGPRTYVYIGTFHLEILKSHINYYWVYRQEYYRVSVPFNLFNKKKYGMSISEDGTNRNARYYRPKREWGLVEPLNDPAYRKALEDVKNKDE